jgi:hypothetical protein
LASFIHRWWSHVVAPPSTNIAKRCWLPARRPHPSVPTGRRNEEIHAWIKHLHPHGIWAISVSEVTNPSSSSSINTPEGPSCSDCSSTPSQSPSFPLCTSQTFETAPSQTLTSHQLRLPRWRRNDPRVLDISLPSFRPRKGIY